MNDRGSFSEMNTAAHDDKESARLMGDIETFVQRIKHCGYDFGRYVRQGISAENLFGFSALFSGNFRLRRVGACFFKLLFQLFLGHGNAWHTLISRWLITTAC
jgi:hypothetical protein